MQRSLRLRVGGLTLSAVAPRPVRFLSPPSHYRPFLVRAGGDIRLRVVEKAPPDPGRATPLFESGSVWRVFRHGARLLYSFRASQSRPVAFKAVLIDRGLRSGTLFFPRLDGVARPAFALDYPLDELLFQHRWVRDGGLEAHACGVVIAGRAALLCGQSGAGKSTSARLWRKCRPSARILSDDRIALRWERGQPFAYGTPWHGDGGFALAARSRLGAVFFLRQAAETRALPLAPAAAAARLLARSFPPPWDAPALERALELVGRIVRTVPCFELQFRPEAKAVRVVETLLRGA